MRTVLLSNVNMDPLKAFLRGWEVTVTDYGDWLLQLLDPSSRAAAAETELVLCHVDGDELLGPQLFGEGEGGQRHYLSALEAFCQRRKKTLVLATTVVLDPLRASSYADLLAPDSLSRVAQKTNDALVELSRGHANLAILDLEAIYRRHGSEQLVSRNYWYAGRIKYSNTMFRLLARHYRQLLAGFLGRSKKVLVLDLDNTLWGGVIGEDGLGGIQLSEDGAGKCYRDFQRTIRALRRTGVLLAINSKNNADDALQVFRQHPMTVLREDDFVARRINWNDKVGNLRGIAAELGLGLDSLVFVDDSPVERALVAEHLPEVAVPDFPKRPEELVAWFLDTVVYPCFPRYRLTREDRQKTEQYRARAERQEAQGALDLDTFLDSLRIELRFPADDLVHLDRASQLTQKTNQFNVTTRRYSTADMRAFIDRADHRVVLVDYRDRFGAEGIVGLAILDLEGGEIDTFLLSCRVIGRGVEGRLLAEAERHLRRAGIGLARASFVPTARNQPAAELFETHGYSLTERRDDGTRRFEKVLS